MADRGFTIKDMLHKHGAELNLPPFLDGRKQFPAEEVSRSRSIASLRIHVERAIGRMKNYKIISGTFRLKLARIANQIVTVVAYLSNFQSSLVPPPTKHSKSKAESTVTDTPSLQLLRCIDVHSSSGAIGMGSGNLDVFDMSSGVFSRLDPQKQAAAAGGQLASGIQSITGMMQGGKTDTHSRVSPAIHDHTSEEDTDSLSSSSSLSF